MLLRTVILFARNRERNKAFESRTSASFWHGHDWEGRLNGKHVATAKIQPTGKLTAVITRKENIGTVNKIQIYNGETFFLVQLGCIVIQGIVLNEIKTKKK